MHGCMRTFRLGGCSDLSAQKSYIMPESASVAQMRSNRSRNKNVNNSVSNEAVNVVTKIVILKPLILFDLNQQPGKI